MTQYIIMHQLHPVGFIGFNGIRIAGTGQVLVIGGIEKDHSAKLVNEYPFETNWLASHI